MLYKKLLREIKIFLKLIELNIALTYENISLCITDVNRLS